MSDASDDETANIVEWMPISARLHGLRTSPSDFRYLSLPNKGTRQEPQEWLEMICKAVREDTDAQHSTHIAVAYSLVNSEELRTNKVDVLHWTRDRRRINFINFREIPMIKKGRSKENILFDAWGTLEDTGSNHMGREVVVTVTIALPFTFPDGKEVFYAYGMQTFWEELVACSRKNEHNGLVIGHKQSVEHREARTLACCLCFKPSWKVGLAPNLPFACEAERRRHHRVDQETQG